MIQIGALKSKIVTASAIASIGSFLILALKTVEAV